MAVQGLRAMELDEDSTHVPFQQLRLLVTPPPVTSPVSSLAPIPPSIHCYPMQMFLHKGEVVGLVSWPLALPSGEGGSFASRIPEAHCHMLCTMGQLGPGSIGEKRLGGLAYREHLGSTCGEILMGLLG